MATPSIVPGTDTTVHLVLDNLGDFGRVYRETDEAKADLETIIEDLSNGQYSDPVRVVAFNAAEGWARDVTEDVALEMLQRAQSGHISLARAGRQFVEYQTGRSVPAEI